MVDQAQRLRELIRNTDDNRQGDGQQNDNRHRHSARVIAITSGKGGVGKTNLSVNLGIALMKLGSRVLLVDADLGLANVDMLLGLVPKFNLGQVITGQKTIDDVITHGPLGLRIVASGSADYKMANLSDRSLEFCLQQLNELEKNTDIMLIDTGAGISRNVLKFVLAAEEVIIVTTPEPTAITDAYGIIKVIASADKTTPIWVVVNMIKDENEGRQVMERLSTVSKRFLGVELTSIGFIPMDPNVSKAVKEQQPFIIGKPRTIASEHVLAIAKTLLGAPLVQKPSRNFFQRLLRGKYS